MYTCSRKDDVRVLKWTSFAVCKPMWMQSSASTSSGNCLQSGSTNWLPMYVAQNIHIILYYRQTPIYRSHSLCLFQPPPIPFLALIQTYWECSLQRHRKAGTKKKRRRHAADDTSNALTLTVFMLTAERIDVVDTVASRVRRSEPPWSPLNTINLIRCRIGSQCTIYRNQGMTFIHTCTHRNRDREREITSKLYLYHDPLSDSSIALQTLTVWSAIDRTLQWTRPRRKSIASTCIVETCQKYGHDIYRENSKQTTAQFTQRNAKCLY